MKTIAISQPFTLEFIGQPDLLWRYTAGNLAVDVGPPVFEIDGHPCIAGAALTPYGTPLARSGGVTEHRWRGPLRENPGLTLEMQARIAPDNPVLRFRYILHSQGGHQLTKASGKDVLTYFTASLADLLSVTEVRLSEFNEMVHSYCLAERPVTPAQFENGLELVGPILTGTDGKRSLLLAYEHGAQSPDAFLHYGLSADRSVALRAVKGNYWHGRVLDAEHPYETLWLHLAVVEGDEHLLASSYRDFVLHFQSDNAESRQPYVFYNTWNYQERVKAWQQRPYLADMNETRMLAEIDAAHGMGIEVFVIDTGWYEKTGDWRVNLDRFPSGMKAVKARLDGYGMKLGLWFNPTIAAVSSRMRLDHDDCIMSRHGKRDDPYEIWETEASLSLCLVSRYAEAFASELIRLVREVGVSYFKWDAINQYGCDDPCHDHGTTENSEQERGDCYAFEQVRAMTKVVDILCAACPEAIVDFDITEGGRSVGLSFLSSGKYFLINNGPYSFNYDLPVPRDGNVNLFFYPGPARAWVCRAPLLYDKWLPTVLFLTHYLPDDRYRKYGVTEEATAEVQEEANQWISLASLVLGQNGIWGDLLSVSPEGVERIGTVLGHYKQVRGDITQAALRRTGEVAGSPEVYEKINAATGRGVVSAFASAPGRYVYMTESQPAPAVWHSPGASVILDAAGHAKIEMVFTEPGAKVFFFGVPTGLTTDLNVATGT
ncbi:MAG: alpha-galactosidase [Janthinobacterium lividum]